MDIVLTTLLTMWAAPRWLWGLVLVPAVPLAYLAVEWRRRRALRRIGNPALVARLVEASRGLRWLRVVLLSFALAFSTLAAARPQWGTVTQIIRTEGMDIVVLLDTSLSMLAEDVPPDRLTAAKDEISAFLDHLTSDRVALVPFAGAAFVQCPLTIDYAAVRLFLRDVTTNTIPVEGTAIGRAIRVGMTAFVGSETRSRVMILITDGEDHQSDPLGAAEEAADAGARIYTIGIGSPEGELIPLAGRGAGTGSEFLRDDEGEIVKTRLGEAALRQIATGTGGRYYRSTSGGAELDEIFDDIGTLERSAYGEQRSIVHVDRYQWPLGAALALLVIIPFIPDRRVRDRGRSRLAPSRPEVGAEARR